jgi:TadE-like protein
VQLAVRISRYTRLPTGREPGKHIGRTGGQRDRGAAAVETAIVLPLLLMLIFGLIDFGRMLNAQITLTEAAREGARAAALGGDPEARAKAVAGDLDISVDPGTPCSASTPDAQVEVHHVFTFVTPVGSLAGMFGGTGMDGEMTLTGRGVMSCL